MYRLGQCAFGNLREQLLDHLSKSIQEFLATRGLPSPHPMTVDHFSVDLRVFCTEMLMLGGDVWPMGDEAIEDEGDIAEPCDLQIVLYGKREMQAA